MKLRTTKIGRNALCPCGSGRKYKKCCIGKTILSIESAKKDDIPAEIHKRAEEMMRLHEAREKVRHQQQGYGNPIVSFVDRGYRIVAIKNKLYWSKNWLTFTDFLLSFIKEVFTIDWGAREEKEGLHPLFRWLKKLRQYRDSTPSTGKLKSTPVKGFIACYVRLSYALYLIAHHDSIPELLLTRLRNYTTFMPAYYETLVGAAFAVAGFELSCAETKASSIPTPEFRAKSKKSGKTYEVEAKRKDSWKASTNDFNAEDFKRELKGWIRDKIYESSKKNLQNPIYWFELSIPTLNSEDGWRCIATQVETTIRDAERNMTIKGKPLQAAFIAVTNHTFLANEDINGAPYFALLQGINVSDYPFGRYVETEASLEAYDKYRDIFWMMDATKIAQEPPVTFDGTPPELLSPEGHPQKALQIGDRILAPNAEGKAIEVTVEEIASMKEHAMAVVYDGTKRWAVQLPLSAGEIKAAARYGDAIFGKSNVGRKLREGDPFDLYDWLLEAYKDTTQEQINKIFSENPIFRPYNNLPVKDARIRIAREYTKLMWAQKEQANRAEP